MCEFAQLYACHELFLNCQYNTNIYLPPLTLSFFALSTSSGIHSLASPTNTAVDKAIHLCPAAPKAAPINYEQIKVYNSTKICVKHYVQSNLHKRSPILSSHLLVSLSLFCLLIFMNRHRIYFHNE